MDTAYRLISFTDQYMYQNSWYTLFRYVLSGPETLPSEKIFLDRFHLVHNVALYPFIPQEQLTRMIGGKWGQFRQMQSGTLRITKIFLEMENFL